MKLNEHTAVHLPFSHPSSFYSLLLIPYSLHHVPTYHTWMESTALQQATASEPLTLEKEYDMQRSWRGDGDKLTFIACITPHGFEGVDGEGEDKRGAREDWGGGRGGEGDVVRGGSEEGEGKMVGDVNLFITDEDDEHEDEQTSHSNWPSSKQPRPGKCIGEVEIMVALPDYQGKGIGISILLTFLWYIFTHLEAIVDEYSRSQPRDPPASTSARSEAQTTATPRMKMKYLSVKISATNTRSIHLFEKVGFVKVSEEANYFGELEFRMPIPPTSTSLNWERGAKAKDVEKEGKSRIAKMVGLDEAPRLCEYRLDGP